MEQAPITSDTVKQRAALDGVTFDEDKIEDVAAAMKPAIEAVRALDLRALRMIEPAAVFHAGWST